MQKLVLLVVGAMWVVALVPPLLRSRGQNRPTSSVDHFRRNLAVLQQTAPGRINPLHSMGRPLAGSRQALSNSYSRAAMKRNPTDPRLRRSDIGTARRTGVGSASIDPVVRHNSEDMTAPLQRRSETRELSRQQILRTRREKTVRMLVTVCIASAVLAFLAKSPALMYACALSVLALFGYCAKLLRLRRDAELYAAQGYSRFS